MGRFNKTRKVENARAFQSFVDQHGRLPVGTVPLDVIKENSQSAKEKITMWLGTWHGRGPETVTVRTFRLLKLPHECLEYQEIRAGLHPSCASILSDVQSVHRCSIDMGRAPRRQARLHQRRLHHEALLQRSSPRCSESREEEEEGEGHYQQRSSKYLAREAS